MSTKGEKMKIKIIATTSTKEENFEDQKSFNNFSGKVAGICYMPGNFEDLMNESEEKTIRRANSTKLNGHHSVFDHEYVSLYLENIPKLLAMMLNNEKIYTTSEKSARYTIMENSTPLEKELYSKWHKIFVEEISKKYGGSSPFFDERRIKKLAQENARYFLSILTPTSMVYTASYRQLNYLCGWMKKFESNENQLIKSLKPQADAFIAFLQKQNLLDESLMNDNKERDFSLFAKRDRKECFDESYSINYTGSYASFAQAQRHRTIKYEIKQIVPPEYYVPELIKNNQELKTMWLKDMQKVAHLHPQAELVAINERGTPEDFILKTKERLCSCAQLEIMRQTEDTLNRYYENTTNEDVKNYLDKYRGGARCVNSNFKCETPCKFKEGINLDREI